MNNNKPLQRQVTQIGDIRFEERKDAFLSNPSSSSTLKRQIPINTNRLSFSPKGIESLNKKRKIEIRGSSLKAYHDFMTLDQAGPATIAYDNAHALFAIKSMKTEASQSTSVQLFRNDCVVNLYDVFRDRDEYRLVYECMDVSLEQVLGTPRGQLASFEIAAICKEVSNQIGTSCVE